MIPCALLRCPVTIIDTLSPTLRDDSESEVATKLRFGPMETSGYT